MDMHKVIFYEDNVLRIRNVAEVWRMDATGPMRKLKLPPSVFSLSTGKGASCRRLEIIANNCHNDRGELAFSVLNLLMFGAGAASAVLWGLLF